MKRFYSKFNFFLLAAANIFYPVNNNRDLIDLLKIVDAKLLARKTAQDFYVSGLGRKVAELIWAPVVERKCFIQSIICRMLKLKLNQPISDIMI